MRAYKARGIVLHTIKYGDTGAVAYIMTDVGGRLSYMVQGVRSKRGHGNKGALLQPMFLVEFEGLSSPRAEMHRFRELRAAVTLRSLPFDVRKSTVSLFMAEMLYRLVREVEANSLLFEFVWEAVRALDGLENAAAVANFHLWFMVGLSRHLGLYPGGEWKPGCWFDIHEGGFTPLEPSGPRFSIECAGLLARLMVGGPAADLATQNNEFADFLAGLALNRAQRADFMNSMLAHFGWHLDAVRDIRSVDILREVF